MYNVHTYLFVFRCFNFFLLTLVTEEDKFFGGKEGGMYWEAVVVVVRNSVQKILILHIWTMRTHKRERAISVFYGTVEEYSTLVYSFYSLSSSTFSLDSKRKQLPALLSFLLLLLFWGIIKLYFLIVFAYTLSLQIMDTSVPYHICKTLFYKRIKIYPHITWGDASIWPHLPRHNIFITYLHPRKVYLRKKPTRFSCFPLLLLHFYHYYFVKRNLFLEIAKKNFFFCFVLQCKVKQGCIHLSKFVYNFFPLLVQLMFHHDDKSRQSSATQYTEENSLDL